MKIPGFHFRETMSGTFTKDGVERAMHFTVTARAASLLEHFKDRKARLDGVVSIDAFASAQPLEGEITIDPLLKKLIRYEFTFAADDGVRYRFVGQKDVTLRDPVGSMTTLPAQVLALDGKLIGTADLKFDTKDLPSFLGSWRLDL
ncbi:MAG: hypothetical protein JWN44_1186 [Myxococcales bacterium]|nr:hypothetical protein [Myxococcales bacterium]